MCSNINLFIKLIQERQLTVLVINVLFFLQIIDFRSGFTGLCYSPDFVCLDIVI